MEMMAMVRAAIWKTPVPRVKDSQPSRGSDEEDGCEVGFHGCASFVLAPGLSNVFCLLWGRESIPHPAGSQRRLP